MSKKKAKIVKFKTLNTHNFFSSQPNDIIPKLKINQITSSFQICIKIT